MRLAKQKSLAKHHTFYISRYDSIANTDHSILGWCAIIPAIIKIRVYDNDNDDDDDAFCCIQIGIHMAKYNEFGRACVWLDITT